MNSVSKKDNVVTKKICIAILILIVAITLATFILPAKVYAEQQDNYNQIEEYAGKFVSKEEGVKINSIVPIYDLNNNIIRYSVNYVNNSGDDYGYVILNKNLNDKRGAVVELSLGNKSKMYSNKEKYYFLDGLDYGIRTGGSNIKTENEVISISNAKKIYKKYLNDNSEIDDGYVDTIYVGEITKELRIADYWYTFTPITQTNLRNAGLNNGDSGGICGLTTAMNVLKYYYDSGLSKYSSLMVTDGSGNIDYATTAYRLNSGYVPSGSVYNLPSNTIRKNALNHYIGTYTSLSKTISKYIGIQFWYYFYNDISNGYIIDVRYDVNNNTGHAVLCIGAVEMSGSHYIGTRYLLVADTWGTNLRLLNFDYYNNLKGMKIKVY